MNELRTVEEANAGPHELVAEMREWRRNARMG